MRTDLLGLELAAAQAVLAGEGVVPSVTQTSAPKRAQREGGRLRVVYASDDGAALTVSAFLDPLSDGGGDNNQ